MLQKIIRLADPEALAVEAARLISAQAQDACRQRGAAHLALSGGSTPRRTYELLGEPDGSAPSAPISGTVEIWFADERCVPPDDPDSNWLLVAQTLLKAPSSSRLRAGSLDLLVHRIEGELGPEEGAARYERLLRGRLGVNALASPPPTQAEHLRESSAASSSQAVGGNLPVLDLVVLGIGPEGHIASLFPGSGALHAPAQQLCLPIDDSPKPPPERVTLSLPVLRAARSCLLLATGEEKADAIRGAIGPRTESLPASLLRPQTLTIIVDEAAAARLEPDG